MAKVRVKSPEITGKGSRDYRCPTCGKVQAFDLEAFLKKAMEPGQPMLKQKRGRG
jgi:hypothetical protein